MSENRPEKHPFSNQPPKEDSDRLDQAPRGITFTEQRLKVSKKHKIYGVLAAAGIVVISTVLIFSKSSGPDTPEYRLLGDPQALADSAALPGQIGRNGRPINNGARIGTEISGQPDDTSNNDNQNNGSVNGSGSQGWSDTPDCYVDQSLWRSVPDATGQTVAYLARHRVSMKGNQPIPNRCIDDVEIAISQMNGFINEEKSVVPRDYEVKLPLNVEIIR